MKRVNYIFIVFFLLSFSLCCNKRNCIDQIYFPKCVLDDSVILLYTNLLVTGNEPSIYCQKYNKNKKIFRFTYFQTLYKIFFIRLEIQNNGSGVLYIKTLSPSKSKLKKKQIEKGKVKYFIKILEKNKFWNLPNLSDKGTQVLDASTWLIEGLFHGKYNVVERWSPEKKDSIWKIGEYLFNLSDLKYELY